MLLQDREGERPGKPKTRQKRPGEICLVNSRGESHKKRDLSSFGCPLIGSCSIKMGKRVIFMLKLDKESKEGAGGEHRFAMAEL